MHSDMARCFLRISGGCGRVSCRRLPPSPTSALNPPTGGTFTNGSALPPWELMSDRRDGSGGTQVIQDTGTGGSYPSSTDRVVCQDVWLGRIDPRWLTA